ncbi:MAG: hypothetical protein HYV16_14870 [Gammaproteobacteria bacterium]|nr:hypothetical protein [Gammaproteobacteria bacterium]
MSGPNISPANRIGLYPSTGLTIWAYWPVKKHDSVYEAQKNRRREAEAMGGRSPPDQS